MDRRSFLRQAPLAAAAAVTATGIARAAERHLAGEPQVRRFTEQRWVLDNIIQANGIDWDQGHLGQIMQRLRSRRARRHERRARAGEEICRHRTGFRGDRQAPRGSRQSSRSRTTTRSDARDNYYTAAVYWAHRDVADRRDRRQDHDVQCQEARELQQIYRARRPSRRMGRAALSRQVAAGDLPSSARLSGRQPRCR